MKKTRIGIDIGNSEIKFAVNTGDSVRLVSAQLPENMVNGGRVQLVNSMREFLKESHAELGLPSGECTLILPDSLVYCQRLKMPYMTEKQMLLNMPYEFRDYIPQDGDSFFFDYAMERTDYNTEGEPESMELMAAAVSKDTIDEYLEIFGSTKYKLECAIPREMAYIYLLRRYLENRPIESSPSDQTNQMDGVDQMAGTEEETGTKQFECCFVDIGQMATRLHFFCGTELMASRSIDFDCQDIDSAIAEQMNVDEYVASTYKRSNYQNVMESEGCREVYDSIAVEIMRAVNFYRFNNRDTNLADLYFLGGGAEIRPLCEAAAEATGLNLHYINEMLPEIAGREKILSCALAYCGLLG